MFDFNPDDLASVTLVHHDPAFLAVRLWQGSEYEAADADTLEVYKSSLVDELDEVYEPVSEFLRDCCFRDDSAETVEDDQMLSDTADRRLVLVFRSCPGSAYSHCCRAGRVD
jgi:hypothetical protein